VLLAAVLLSALAACGPGGPGNGSDGGPPPTASEFRKAPYLIFRGNNTQMTVLWQTISAGTSRISWGTDTSYGSGSESVDERSADHLFRYDLPGLTPGRKYFYRVELADGTATGSFTAAPADGSPVSLFMYGDSRSNPAVHDMVAARMVAAYDADPALQGIALHAGDLVYDGNVEENWDGELFNPQYPNIRRFLSEIPLEAAIGNHDGNGLLFTTYLPYPFVSDRYWSFDYGVVHVTVVDQYAGLSSGQLNWIASDLAGSAKPWKIILLHAPGWSAGTHANSTSVQQDIQPLAVAFGVALVVAGHNHNYARAVVEGVEHITTGGGGASLYTPVLPSPNVVAAERAYHFCVVEASAGTLSFRAVRTDGSTIDSFTLTR
jgi:hypothetical protein